MNLPKVFLLNILSSFLLISCENNHNNNNNEKPRSKPIIISHRGAQSLLPEHTIEGFSKAIELGTDFIEPDLVLTKDGYLIVRHEPMLSGTTNVSEIEAFAGLKTTKNIDGKMVTDWFAIDFTLAQIKQLKAKQSYKGRSTEFDNQFDIPTFEEVIDVARTHNIDKVIGIYPDRGQ